MNQIKVHLDRKTVRSYDIFVGRDILDRAGIILAGKAWASRYVIVTDATIAVLHGERVRQTLSSLDLKVDLLAIPAGEKAKQAGTCLEIMERLLAAGADRATGLIALGGGVVGDVTGFVASTFLRGVPYIQMPTTLLAQVDSSIGGKTAVDLPAGKNLMGTFYQPKAVFVDLAFLDTLPDGAFADGFAEIAKLGIIDDPAFFALLEAGSDALRRRDPALVAEVVVQSCRIKKALVEIDEMDCGARRFLNFGHTVGHALEAASGYSLSHGEAVSIGMAAAAHLSERLGHLSGQERARIVALLHRLGLPDRIPGGLPAKEILERMKVDKKATAANIHFVLIRKIGIPFLNGGVPSALVEEVIEGLRG